MEIELSFNQSDKGVDFLIKFVKTQTGTMPYLLHISSSKNRELAVIYGNSLEDCKSYLPEAYNFIKWP